MPVPARAIETRVLGDSGLWLVNARAERRLLGCRALRAKPLPFQAHLTSYAARGNRATPGLSMANTGQNKTRQAKQLGRRPKANGGDRTRDAILNAAEKLFAEHGLDGVTVRDITKEAGVDVALAHYYFNTKRGLFDAVFMR